MYRTLLLSRKFSKKIDHENNKIAIALQIQTFKSHFWNDLRVDIMFNNLTIENK